MQNHKGRKIGTLVKDTAIHLQDFNFEQEDLILFGSEKEGLPSEVIELLDASIYIPAIGYTNCLNVAVSFGIVMQQAILSLE